jgi:hypothetical protein
MTRRPAILGFAVVGVLTFAATAGWSAQSGAEGTWAAKRESRTRAELARMLSPFGIDLTPSPVPARRWRRIELDWTRPGADLSVAEGEAPAERALTIRRERIAGAAPACLRALELSPTQILIVATDSQRRVTWWTVRPDPRLFRAETADDRGNLIDGGAFYRAAVAFTVDAPDDPQVQDLDVYKPHWNGAEFELERLATVSRARQQGGTQE